MKAGFDGLDYTRQALAEELALTERHARDGSAVDAGCACIEEKHLLTIAGLSSEGVTLAKDAKEKQFYMDLANLCRDLRKKIVYADWTGKVGCAGVCSCSTAKKKGGFDNPTATVTFDSTIKRPNLGHNEVNLDTGQIYVSVHPTLKKDKKAREVVIRHEINEALCNLHTADACHRLASNIGGKEEEKIRKKYDAPLYMGFCIKKKPVVVAP